MSHWLIRRLAPNLAQPRSKWWSNVVWKWNAKSSERLSKAAVKLCGDSMVPGNRVLEIGFGQGKGLDAALSTGAHVYGVELSNVALLSSYDRLQKMVEEEKLILIETNISSLPFPTDWFHAAFHTNSFPYWANLDTACAELYRVVRPGGVVIATLDLNRQKKRSKSLPFTQRLFNASVAYSRSIGKKTPDSGVMVHKLPHWINTADPLEYMLSLERVGFEPVTFEYYDDHVDMRCQCVRAIKPLTANVTSTQTPRQKMIKLLQEEHTQRVQINSETVEKRESGLRQQS